MKAAVCRHFAEALSIEEVSIGAPRVAACAICQSDVHYIDGAWGSALPAICGHEAAGVVEEIGPGVSSVAEGDHVVITLIRSCGRCRYCLAGQRPLCEGEFPPGDQKITDAKGAAIVQGLRTAAFAEYVVVDASQVVAIPSGIPLASAALIACGVVTGVGAVSRNASVNEGESVVIIGTGGVGINCVQGARLKLAHPIIAVDINEAKLRAASDFGADHVIDLQKTDAREAVLSLTAGRGADHVFISVGSAKAVEQGMGLLRRGGSLIIAGMPPSGVEARFDLTDFVDSGRRIVGSKMGSTHPQRDIPELVSLYLEGRLMLDELISGEYPLDRIDEAIDSSKSGDALRNIIVF
ncbi:MAG: Zn-dependent alcohol dehydrogenase [Ectothiorhodospiraceae bacterium AqS1]|nr:Zn-dependent alcohol dehydrogenase [Ectothiorhodospiraceae bacterium AqS1]